jgi:hypothetical protein
VSDNEHDEDYSREHKVAAKDNDRDVYTGPSGAWVLVIFVLLILIILFFVLGGGKLFEPGATNMTPTVSPIPR